jgi:peptide chain release factor 1
VRVTGKGAELLSKEAGGHRWQRVPPGEKRGKRHSSTVTVAVLPEPTERQLHIDRKDLEYKTCRGSGAGGQHRNTTDSAVQLTHLPTGTAIRIESERSQHRNRELALGMLRARLAEQGRQEALKSHNNTRKNQVGSGMRGDKAFSIQMQNNRAVRHIEGSKDKKMSARRYLKGHIEDLW